MVSKVVGDQVIEWLFWGFSLLLIFQRCGFETIDQLSCSRVAVLLLQIKRDDDSLAITCDYCTRSVPAVTLLNAGKPTLENTSLHACYVTRPFSRDRCCIEARACQQDKWWRKTELR